MMKNFVKNVCIILVKPQSNENLGAVARAMHNFGFYHLILVSPFASPASKAAEATAHGSHPVLQKCKTFNSLRDAIADQQIVIGTTQRYRKSGEPIHNIRDILLQKSILSGHKIAIVFGSEKSGLSNEDLTLCDFIFTIQTINKQPSLNLAQAVILFLYEISRIDTKIPLPSLKPASKARTDMLKEAFINLLEIANFNPADTVENFVNILFRSLKRASLEDRDVNAWLKFIKHLDNRYERQMDRK